jgi:magnesium chelatase family protein
MAFLTEAIEKLGLSARAYHRIIRLARTIADLAHSAHINSLHLQEALSYRHFQQFSFSPASRA